MCVCVCIHEALTIYGTLTNTEMSIQTAGGAAVDVCTVGFMVCVQLKREHITTWPHTIAYTALSKHS